MSKSDADSEVIEHEPYVPDSASPPEFTWPAVLAGAVLGIVFGASSLYLVLKAGMTVSASIPVAVLSITIFRAISRMLGTRPATILENNIVQTVGSAGESIAFAVGVTIPALMMLGFEMEVIRVMTAGVLGGLLGILMMIPLRRAFIVKQHGKLTYPEGTACADVLIAGDKGGATAKMVFAGFGIAFLHKFLMKGLMLWKDEPSAPLYTSTGKGLVGAEIGGELSPELLGVGFIIGPRIAGIMMAGGMLAYLVFTPLIVMFSSQQSGNIAPGTKLVSEMSVSDIRNNYILYIGAGAVATGGIISLFQALPMIISSAGAGLKDLLSSRKTGKSRRTPRTERDLPLSVTWGGSLALVVILMAIPALGLGFNLFGLVGAGLIVFFGFLFVTVSARLTGEIGSSSNPISGMTVATLLLTCLAFLLLGKTDKAATLTALTVAAIVCVAASNAGSTAQDLKTGFLVGATPRSQQVGIAIGALTSALVIGVVLLKLNDAYTVYTSKPEYLPSYRVEDVSRLTLMERAGGDHADDPTEYHVLNLAQGEIEGVPQGKYLVDDSGVIRYYVDPAINGRLKERDNGAKIERFNAPKTRLMGIIIDGIMNQRLPWGLVIIGALIAITLELARVPSLPFAVGFYLPISTSVPVFIGGMARLLVDKLKPTAEADQEMSPGMLAASGFIAGGSIAGVVAAFFEFLPDGIKDKLRVGERLPSDWINGNGPSIVAVAAFGVLLVLLILFATLKVAPAAATAEKCK